MPPLPTLRLPFRWACVASARRTQPIAERFGSVWGIALLVQSVHQKAMHRVEKLTRSQRGPCYSGVLDGLTGVTSYGTNFDLTTVNGRAAYAHFCSNIHPLLKARVDVHKQDLANGTVVVKMTAGTPGSHAEIVALDKALKVRESRTGIISLAVDLATFYLHNRSTMTGTAGKPMSRCDNCYILTSGVKPVLHL